VRAGLQKSYRCLPDREAGQLPQCLCLYPRVRIGDDGAHRRSRSAREPIRRHRCRC
jgi:hypothetical protein